MKIMASEYITSWQINGETVRFYFLGLHADGDCSHEIKIYLFLGRKPMTNLDSILKSSFPFSQSLLSGSFHKPLIHIPQKAGRMKTTITEN